jgi:integrase
VSLIQNAVTGMWEADVKDRMAGRLHISMRTKIKREATTRYAAFCAFVKEGDIDLINRLRDQKIHVEAIERCVRDRVPFATLRGMGERWPTVADAIASYVAWLAANAKKAERTSEAAEKQLKPFSAFAREDGRVYGTLRIDEITMEEFARYQLALATDANDGSPYAQNTQTAYIGRVAALYAWHRQEEERNAIQQRRTPRTLHSPVDPRTQPRETTARDRYLSQPEAELLIAATPDQLRLPVLLGLYCGLRASEMLHLRPALDLDLVAGFLKVQRKEWYRGKRLMKWKPKTKRSTRHVPLNDDVLAVLHHHLKHYASRDWLMPAVRDRSQPIHFNQFSRSLRQVVEDAGLEPGRGSPTAVSYHALRHTFATWLVMADENLLTVAKLLGNSVQMVEQVYGHLAPEHRKKAVGRLNGMVPIPPAITPDVEDN